MYKNLENTSLKQKFIVNSLKIYNLPITELQCHTACNNQNGRKGASKWHSHQLSENKFFDSSPSNMRKVDNREEKRVGAGERK